MSKINRVFIFVSSFVFVCDYAYLAEACYTPPKPCMEDAECSLDQCCVNGYCETCCDPDGGSPCVYTLSPLHAMCAFVNIDDFSCLDPGAFCGWNIIDGPSNNATKKCSCIYDFVETACVWAEAKVCQNGYRIGFGIYCKCKDPTGLVIPQTFGTSQTCQLLDMLE